MSKFYVMFSLELELPKITRKSVQQQFMSKFDKSD